MDLPGKGRDWDGAQKSAHTFYRALGFVPASCVVVVPPQCDCMILPQRKGKDHFQENVMLEALHCCVEPGGSRQLLVRWAQGARAAEESESILELEASLFFL